MPTLLHIDSSIRGADSVSREITAAFTEHWQKANPDGEVVYRDLAANPVPHLDNAAYSAAFTPAENRTPEQEAGLAISQALIDELLAADVVVLGVPMYNFTVPDTFKSWLDRILGEAVRPNPETGEAPLGGTRFVVVHSRGGSYKPGTPREDWEFQESYLRKVFIEMLQIKQIEFVAAELTLAKVNPAMTDLIPLGEQSLADAHSTIRELAAVEVAA
jgi:FMN-dependent NADH-azoreductase